MGEPGVLQSMGSQRVGHDLGTEQQQRSQSLVRWIPMPQRSENLGAGDQYRQVHYSLGRRIKEFSFLVCEKSAGALLRGRLQAAQLPLQGRGSISDRMSANALQHPGLRGALCGSRGRRQAVLAAVIADVKWRLRVIQEMAMLLLCSQEGPGL